MSGHAESKPVDKAMSPGPEAKVTLESLVEQVGAMGRFQIVLLIFAFLPVFLCVSGMIFMVFGAVEPDWSCLSLIQTNQSGARNESHVTSVVSDDWANSTSPSLSSESSSFGSINSGSHNRSGSRSAIVSVNSKVKLGSVSKQCQVLFSEGGQCDVVVFSSGPRTIVTEFQLICGRSWVISLIISLQMVGVLVGAAVAGQLADSVGRKKALLTFTTLFSLFNFVAAASVSWIMFAALRVLIGTAIGGLLAAYFAYPTEFLGVQYRALVATVPFWPLGLIFFSLLCWALPNWVYLHVVIGALTALCVPAWFVLPESVRWLTVKGRVTEAHSVLCFMARCNGRQPPSLADVSAVCALRPPEKSAKKYSYLDIFSKPRIARISVLSGWMWICAALSYYGVSFGIKNLTGDFHLNFLFMSLMELPAPLFVYHLSAIMGRRWLTSLNYLVLSICMFAVLPVGQFFSEKKAGVIVNVLSNLGRFCIQLGWSAMTLLHAELYPTVVRNIGLGYLNTISRVGAILAPFLLSVKGPTLFYSLIGSATLTTALGALLLPETRGQPLQDSFTTSEESEEVEENGKLRSEACNKLLRDSPSVTLTSQEEGCGKGAPETPEALLQEDSAEVSSEDNEGKIE